MFLIDVEETINLDRQVEEKTKPNSNTAQITSETIKPETEILETVKLEALTTEPVIVLLVPLSLVEMLLILV